MKKNLRVEIIGIIFLLIHVFASCVHADRPAEKYRVHYNEISERVLVDTVGTLGITFYRINKGLDFKGNEDIDWTSFRAPVEKHDFMTYELDKNLFKKGSFINLLKQGKPVSGCEWFFYVTEEPIKSITHRYPITETNQNYLCIVIDPIDDTRIWINKEEIPKDYLNVIIFNEIRYNKKDKQIPEKIKIYDDPDEESRFAFLSHIKEMDCFISIRQKNGFALLGQGDPVLEPDSVKPFGWIRIRDDKGRLLIWFLLPTGCWGA